MLHNFKHLSPRARLLVAALFFLLLVAGVMLLGS